MTDSRRQFVKSLVGLTGVHLLSACSTLDRLFMGESSNLTDAVVIVGAGLSGLTCAFELKKVGIPYVIFEANSRVGGQIQTLNQHFGTGTWVDLGPEFFTSQDFSLLNLIEELGLKPQILSFDATLPKLLKASELKKIHSQWQKNLTDSVSADWLKILSLVEWGMSLSRDSAWLQALEDWSWYRAGVSGAYVSASRFIEEFKLGPQYPWLSPELSIEGGLSQMIDRLASNVFGAFPEKKLRLNHQLQSVEPLGRDSWDLIFVTPKGRRRYEVRNVILTQNPKLLSALSGLDEFVQCPTIEVPHLSIKWVKSSSWQKAYRKLGLEPRWGRQFQKIGAWGQVRSQKFVEFGLLESSSQFNINLATETDFIVKDWMAQKFVGGRSLGALIEPYQPKWNLPQGWYSTQKIEKAEFYGLSPLELSVRNSKNCVTQIMASRRT